MLEVDQSRMRTPISRVARFPLQVNNPPADRDRYSLRAIARSELFHDVFDMNFDGLFRDEEFFRDIPIAIPASHMLENINFPVRQRFVAEMLRQMSSDLGGNFLLPDMNLSDHIDKLLRRHVLQQVRTGAGLKSAMDFNITLKSRQHDDARIREFASDCNQRIDAADIGKSEVHECYVRSMFSELLNRVGAAGGFADQRHIRLTVDDDGNSLPEKWMIINA